MGGVYFANMGRRNPLTDWAQFFLGKRYPWRNQACQIWWRSPTLIIPTKFEVDMCIHCRVIAFLSADTSRNLVTLTFAFRPYAVVMHGESRDQPCHQVWSPYAYPFSSYELYYNVIILYYNVSPWLPLKMHTLPLRMRRITWPMSRGWKTITFLESPTPICLFTIQLRSLYDEYN